MPLDLAHWTNQKSDEEFTSIVNESFSILEIEEKLGYNSYSGSVASSIKRRIEKLGIDISHFRSRQVVERSEENIFIENSTAHQSVLRKWYLKGNYTPYICSICGQEPIWQSKPLTLILDHINGKHNDDRLENLRWVCPNCNQQLDTTGSRNKAYKQEKQPKVRRCIDCGNEISYKATRCRACAAKIIERNSARCPRDELKSLIRTTPFTKIGEKFEVTDNAVRKWCKFYGLPFRVSEIKKISDEDWSKI